MDIKKTNAARILDRQKLTGNIYAEFTPIKHLVWRTELGFDISGSKATRYEPMVDLGGWKRPQNSMSTQKNTNTFWEDNNCFSIRLPKFSCKDNFVSRDTRSHANSVCWVSVHNNSIVWINF